MNLAVIKLIFMLYACMPVANSPFGNSYWIITSSTIQPALDLDMDGKPDTDLLKVVPACERDDANLYREDGMIVTNRGKLSCEEEEEMEEETGTWNYDSKTKKLVLEYYDSRKPVEAVLEEQGAGRLVFVATHESAKGKHAIRTVFTTK